MNMRAQQGFVISRRQVLSLGAGAVAAVGLAACSGGSQESAPATDATQEAVTTDDVTQLTVVPGKLTIATGEPAYEPWVSDDDPESGKGFEAALAYALAEKMGFKAEDVEWTRTTFEEAFAPGEHDWDLNMQQVSINEDRKKAVDFSPGYFHPTQAVVVLKDSDFAQATSLADLADATIAVQVGSTAFDYVKDLIKGGSEEGIEPFNDNADAAQAVSNGQVDAIVTDTPDAVVMASFGQIEDGLVVGQIANTEDEFGLGATLAKDSALTPFVTEAMNALIEDGTVDKLTKKWLAEYTTDIPVLL